MRLIQIILLVLTFNNCRHYFVRDAAKYNLTQEEENILMSKKIGVVGFHPFYKHGMQSCCDNSNPQLLSNNLMRMLQFVYEKNNSEDMKFDPNYFVTGKGRYRRELRLSDQDTEKEFLKIGVRLDSKGKTKPDTTIPETNLRLFLKTYLEGVQHLGYREVVNLIDFSDKNKIYLKKNDFDYWIIGFHSPITSDINLKSLLSFVPFIYTLGIFPLWKDENINTNIWILDKNLFLLKELEFKNEYTFFAASWVFWQDQNTSGLLINYSPNYIYEPDLKEFQKELVKIIKEN